MISLLIADDHNIILDGITDMLHSDSELKVVSTANNGAEVLEKLKLTSYDIVLLDINMPVMDGMRCAEEILKIYPKQNIMMLTMNEEKSIIEKMISIGVKGFLLKTTDKEDLINAIKTIHSGKEYFSADVTKLLISKKETETFSSLGTLANLTEREIEIVKHIANGLSSNEIAEQLFISPRTVETHRNNIIKKLGVNNVAGVVRFAFQHQLVY
jgi:DNA-binding NarL/FixJ family response regulator